MASTGSAGARFRRPPREARTFGKESPASVPHLCTPPNPRAHPPHPTPHRREICISCISHSAATVNFIQTLAFHVLSHLPGVRFLLRSGWGLAKAPDVFPPAVAAGTVCHPRQGSRQGPGSWCPGRGPRCPGSRPQGRGTAPASLTRGGNRALSRHQASMAVGRAVGWSKPRRPR